MSRNASVASNAWRAPASAGCAAGVRGWQHGVLADRREETLGRRRHALDVDVLARRSADEVPQPEEQRRAAGAAASEDDRDARGDACRPLEDGQDAALERRPLRNDHRFDSSCTSDGMSMPCVRAISIASG